MKILKEKDFKTSQWSGGKTTELFIFPENSEYQEQNFDFRISSATIETENSNFTELPDYLRNLMILEGEVFINHEDFHSKNLKKFDTDQFHGSWITTSQGKCVDFNVMTNENYTNSLKHLTLLVDKKININKNSDFLFIYLYSGSLKISISNQTVFLNKNNMLILDKNSQEQIVIHSIKKSELVLTEIEKIK